MFYNFVEEDSGNILATLELTSLPATHEEVAGLTFTPAGEAVFGLGSTYGGTFDEMAPASWTFVGSEQFGLIPSGCGFACAMLDNDPPPSTIVADVEYVAVGFIVLTGQAVIRMNDMNPVNAFGLWQAVPEPSTAFLLILSLVFGAAVRRWGQRHS